MSGPLAGIRVLDLGTRIGAPFAATLLADLGAEVIKVELPGQGDFMRTIGPFVGDYSLFWAVEGRGNAARRSVTPRRSSRASTPPRYCPSLSGLEGVTPAHGRQ